MRKMILRNIPDRLQGMIKINIRRPKHGGERQRKLRMELLEEYCVLMHVKTHTSYINVAIRCLFELAEKMVD